MIYFIYLNFFFVNLIFTFIDETYNMYRVSFFVSLILITLKFLIIRISNEMLNVKNCNDFWGRGKNVLSYSHKMYLFFVWLTFYLFIIYLFFEKFKYWIINFLLINCRAFAKGENVHFNKCDNMLFGFFLVLRKKTFLFRFYFLIIIFLMFKSLNAKFFCIIYAWMYDKFCLILVLK